MSLTALDYTAQQLVALALEEAGYTEGAGNANKYGAALDMNGAPWCALYVEWVARQAGGSLVEHLGIDWSHRGWTPSWAAAGRAAGRLVSSTIAQAGDLVLFDFPDRVERVQHIGLVTGPANGATLPTVEGNTSADDGGSQSNGGGVHQRRRSHAHVVAVVRPLYATAEGEDMTPEERKQLAEVHAMLSQLVGPRRADRKDTDPARLSLADLYTQDEQTHRAVQRIERQLDGRPL
jgi:hypothetical protein